MDTHSDTGHEEQMKLLKYVKHLIIHALTLFFSRGRGSAHTLSFFRDGSKTVPDRPLELSDFSLNYIGRFCKGCEVMYPPRGGAMARYLGRVYSQTGNYRVRFVLRTRKPCVAILRAINVRIL